MSKTSIFYFILDLLNEISYHAAMPDLREYRQGIVEGKKADIGRICAYIGWDTQMVVATIKKLGNKKILAMSFKEVNSLVEKF